MDIQDWLHTQTIAADAYDPEALLTAFHAEMENGLNGDPSSLAMIPAYVNTDHKVPHNTNVAIIDAGGTNLRTGLATFGVRGGIHLSHFVKQPMPGRDHAASAADFYAALVDTLEPLRNDFEKIGFCFSYPAVILPNFDGRLLHWTKEIKVPELVGQHIGAGLLDALSARGINGKRIVLLNDTVATLLAGMVRGQTFNADTYIGFILGTGTNTAYVEQNANIGKLKNNPQQGTQVINVESGGFSAFKRGSADIRLDERSETPGTYRFEKTISGVYMGPLTLELLKALADEHVLSASAATTLAECEILSTIHVDNLAANNGRDIGILGTDVFTDADRHTAKTVFNAVVDRAALLTAINIAAAVIQSGGGQDPTQPVCVNIDGSTYYKTHQLADKVQANLKTILDPRGLHIRCIKVDDAPIVGAASAGLTTFA